MELNEDGGVTVGSSWEDHGQGADSGALGTAHEALRPMGIPAEKIRLVHERHQQNSQLRPGRWFALAGGHGQRHSRGREMLMEGMRKPAGGFLDYAGMKAEGRPLRYDGKWSAPAKDCDANGQGSPFACYMYGLFMAEVAVEKATGKTQVEKLTCVADIGELCNQLIVDGQIYGGLAQGVGFGPVRGL